MEEWLIVSVKEIAKHQGNHTILCGLKTTFTHKKTSVFYCQISYFQNKLNKLSHKSWLKKKKKKLVDMFWNIVLLNLPS